MLQICHKKGKSVARIFNKNKLSVDAFQLVSHRLETLYNDFLITMRYCNSYHPKQ